MKISRKLPQFILFFGATISGLYIAHMLYTTLLFYPLPPYFVYAVCPALTLLLAKFWNEGGSPGFDTEGSVITLSFLSAVAPFLAYSWIQSFINHEPLFDGRNSPFRALVITPLLAVHILGAGGALYRIVNEIYKTIQKENARV